MSNDWPDLVQVSRHVRAASVSADATARLRDAMAAILAVSAKTIAKQSRKMVDAAVT